MRFEVVERSVVVVGTVIALWEGRRGREDAGAGEGWG